MKFIGVFKTFKQVEVKSQETMKKEWKIEKELLSHILLKLYP
jgi:hypothetical protein